MTTTALTPASPPSTALAKVDVAELAIIGIRRDGPVLVVIESASKGALEHRCKTERELWLCLAAIADRHGAQIVDGKQGSELKRERAKLAEAFGVLVGKARTHAADKVGEETVGAVETIGSFVGAKAVAGLRSISTRGSSTLHRGSRGVPARRKGSGGGR